MFAKRFWVSIKNDFAIDECNRLMGFKVDNVDRKHTITVRVEKYTKKWGISLLVEMPHFIILMILFAMGSWNSRKLQSLIDKWTAVDHAEMRRSAAAFYSLIFEIVHCLANNTVQYGVLTFKYRRT